MPLSDANREKVFSISGKLTLYKSDWRSNMIKFCGWTETHKKGTESKKELENLCAAALKQENNVAGCHMRACVMAALHHDFALAF